MLPGPPPSSASRTSWAAAVMATAHDVSASPPSPRTSGAPSRSGDPVASKLKRPRSQSHDQFTGSESTPR